MKYVHLIQALSRTEKDQIGALDDNAVGNYNIYQNGGGEILLTKHKLKNNYALMETANTFEEAYQIIQQDWEDYANSIVYDKELEQEYRETIFDFVLEEEETLEDFSLYDLSDEYDD